MSKKILFNDYDNTVINYHITEIEINDKKQVYKNIKKNSKINSAIACALYKNIPTYVEYKNKKNVLHNIHDPTKDDYKEFIYYNDGKLLINYSIIIHSKVNYITVAVNYNFFCFYIESDKTIYEAKKWILINIKNIFLRNKIN